jgi:uncharacterized linocin/CFP29 family protein
MGSELFEPFEWDEIEVARLVDSIGSAYFGQEYLRCEFTYYVVDLFGKFLKKVHPRDRLVLFELNESSVIHQQGACALETVELVPFDIDLDEIEAWELFDEGVEVNHLGLFDRILRR